MKMMTSDDAIGHDTLHPIPHSTVYEKPSIVPDLAQWIRQLSAFLPVYQNGNSTMISLENEETWYLPWKVQTQYQKVAEENCVDTRALRRAYEELIGHTLYLPLVTKIYPAIYVPLKVRHPDIRNDGAVGYFRTRDIAIVKPIAAQTTLITLTNHHSFFIDMKKILVDRRIRNARNFDVLLDHRGDNHL
ncbi:hypothetical protein [Alicyclobacillus dauci]|uniref:ComK protein n=1 Tax=Alicyclobacillus dauci TaxID=1475485 RepID=A0ABY6Z1Y3_9BACL|nr:hypothetical protein [Alicyclobacillus dauci]WAH36841.1 hypothetical protein NZD86_22170 [Alicyclobacillus dauci]